jgi:hypothetical protein
VNTLSKDKLEHILCYAKQQQAINLPCKVPPEDMVAIVEMALRKEWGAAAPVAEIRAHYPLGIDGGKQKFIQPCGELPDFGAMLYAAPPAQPVTVPDMPSFIADIRLKKALLWIDGVIRDNPKMKEAKT